MRAKTKVIQEPLGLNPKDYPDWSFDGSSTGQAEGNNSDCILKYGLPSGFIAIIMTNTPGSQLQSRQHMYLQNATCVDHCSVVLAQDDETLVQPMDTC